jgi:hypothetical protein
MQANLQSSNICYEQPWWSIGHVNRYHTGYPTTGSKNYSKLRLQVCQPCSYFSTRKGPGKGHCTLDGLGFFNQSATATMTDSITVAQLAGYLDNGSDKDSTGLMLLNDTTRTL